MRYTIVITTHSDQRLHYRTNDSKLILFMLDCATDCLIISIAKKLTYNELLIVEAYLDNPKSCEVIDNLTKQCIYLP